HQTKAGYGSSSEFDEGRGEMWFPLWVNPVNFQSLSQLICEGRVRVGCRNARNGLDFARAVSGLGVDRGISAFERYGIQKRNGDAHFAVPLGRFEVRSNPDVEMLDTIDPWLNIFLSRIQGVQTPASVRLAG